MIHYEVFVSVAEQKGVVRVSYSYPTIMDSSSAINYALDVTRSCYPDAKVEFLFVKEYLLDSEPDVGYVYEQHPEMPTYH